MRLILALAAHFKPSASASHRAGASVGRSSTGSSANHRPHSTMAMAQNAAAALAAARQDAARPGRSVFHLRQEWRYILSLFSPYPSSKELCKLVFIQVELLS